MACEKEAGGLGFYFGHQLTVAAIADVVLGNSFRIKDRVLKSGFPLNPEQHAQVFACEGNKFVRRQGCQFRVSLAADVAGERKMAGRRAVWKQRRGEDCSENF